MKAQRAILEKVAGSEKITVRTKVEVKKLEGDGGLEHVVIEDREGGGEERIQAAALFVFIGLSPNSGWLPEDIEKDDGGFICTGPTLETSIPGVFSAGDVRKGATRQAASAAGEGATVALMVRDYLNRH